MSMNGRQQEEEGSIFWETGLHFSVLPTYSLPGPSYSLPGSVK